MEGKHKSLKSKKKKKKRFPPETLVDSASPDDRPLGPCLPQSIMGREFVLPARVSLFSCKARLGPKLTPGTSQLAGEINHEEKRRDGIVAARLVLEGLQGTARSVGGGGGGPIWRNRSLPMRKLGRKIGSPPLSLSLSNCSHMSIAG